MTLFGWGIALARDFDLFPAFLVFSIGWFLLSSLEVASKRPSALYRPRSYLELMSVLLLGTSAGTRKIKPNENLDKIKEYEAEQAEMRRVRDEILKTMEMEQKKYEAYLEAQTSNLNEEVDMATKARGGGITSFTLAPFRGILLPIQHLLHDVCVGLRITTSIVVWRDSYVSFWIVTACFVASFVLLWIPWTFLIKWTFKISVWLFLGPWMKLVDICYFRREYDAEQKKEDLAEEFNERYQALVGESLFLKMRKETALKLKDMKKYMFGQVRL